MAAVKALQQWCRVQCEGYRDVSITNMTTSFRDGLAFCALIHRHRPELIDFNSLKKENVYENNHLAFSVAEQQLGIPALLDAEDMVALRVPDRLSILTYVSQYYNYFHGRSPIGGMAGVKRPAEGATEQQPAGKKNQPVSAKVFPSSGPTKENHPPADYSRPASAQAPRHTNNKQDVPVERSPQTGTLSNKCVSCNKHVHLVQRYLVDGKLYHRNCAKTLTPNAYTADLQKNLSLSRVTPDPDPAKTSPRPGPTWLTNKAITPSSVSGNSAPVNASKPSTSSTVFSYVSPPKTSAPAKTNITFSSSTSPHSAPANASKPSISSTVSSYVSPPKTSAPAKTNITFSSSTSPHSAPANASKPSISSTVSSYVSPPKTSAPAKTNITVSSSTSPHSALVNASKPAAPSTFFTSISPPQPSKPSRVNVSTSVSPSQPANSTPAKTNTTSIFPLRPATFTPVTVSKSGSPSESMTTTVSITPVAAPRTSIAAKNLQAKLKFFQSNDADGDEEEKSKKTRGVEGVPGQLEETAPPSHAVTVMVHVGGKDRDLGKSSVALEKEGEQSRAKASAAAFISKKLTEENNNKPAWTVTPKTQNKQTPVEAPKKEPEGVRGRVKLRANPSLLSDLNISRTTAVGRSPSPAHTRSTTADRRSPSPAHTRSTTADRRSPSPAHTRSTTADRRSPSPAHTRSTTADRRSPSPAHTRSTGTRAPDRGAQKPRSPSPNISAGPQSETPSDWRALLKPASKDSRSPASSQSSSKPWINGSGQTRTPDPIKPGSGAATPSIYVTPPAPKGFTTSPRDTAAPEALTKNTKMKPDYIPKEEILKELQQIEDSLNELERTGVELELKLRTSEENGEDESVMNELMVEWFTLIRNKQVAMRRESELVYIGRTQELEEEQPTVEQELRRLLDKPEHLKTSWDRRRQEELMDKLLEIVNDRNAIVEGLDEDRLREGEEDEQLNQLMQNFNLKRDKSKKKSPMSKLFSWGSKDT